jgi:hypothetical protein
VPGRSAAHSNLAEPGAARQATLPSPPPLAASSDPRRMTPASAKPRCPQRPLFSDSDQIADIAALRTCTNFGLMHCGKAHTQSPRRHDGRCCAFAISTRRRRRSSLRPRRDTFRLIAPKCQSRARDMRRTLNEIATRGKVCRGPELELPRPACLWRYLCTFYGCVGRPFASNPLMRLRAESPSRGEVRNLFLQSEIVS